MTKPVFLILLLVALLALPAAGAQVARADRTAVRAAGSAPVKAPFAVGERLNYDVSWSNFIVAGELTLETRARDRFDGVDGYHVSALAQSVGVVSAVVMKVREEYQSYLNAATLLPFRAEKNSRRGSRREQASITLDQQKGTAVLDDGRRVEIPPDTYDIAGLIYAIRAMDLTQGKGRVFNLLEDGKIYPLKVTPQGKEKLTTRTGDYNVVRVGTELVGRAGRDPYKLKIYLTNDARRLPVLILAEPSWGEVRVELTSATGTQKP